MFVICVFVTVGTVEFLFHPFIRRDPKVLSCYLVHSLIQCFLINSMESLHHFSAFKPHLFRYWIAHLVWLCPETWANKSGSIELSLVSEAKSIFSFNPNKCFISIIKMEQSTEMIHHSFSTDHAHPAVNMKQSVLLVSWHKILQRKNSYFFMLIDNGFIKM